MMMFPFYKLLLNSFVVLYLFLLCDCISLLSDAYFTYSALISIIFYAFFCESGILYYILENTYTANGSMHKSIIRDD